VNTVIKKLISKNIISKSNISIITEGKAWNDVLNKSNIKFKDGKTGDYRLYITDDVHQNISGAYLSAACIYKSVLHGNPTLIKYDNKYNTQVQLHNQNYRLLEDDAKALLKIANANCN
jgi:hypothetical protein